jgi:mutator protein MutT
MAQDLGADSDSRPFTEVAVGLVIRPQTSHGAVQTSGQKVLMGQRPEGKAYTGWWEFPGGKIEAGETVDAALARELNEELNLNIQGSLPWVVRTHSYPHARVRLHFRRIFAWTGEPTAMEKQAFAWQPMDRIVLEPLLPAALPLLQMLRWPSRLALIGFTEAGVSADRCFEGLTDPLVQASQKLLLRFDESFHCAVLGEGAGALQAAAYREAIGLVLDRASHLGVEVFLARDLKALGLAHVAGYWWTAPTESAGDLAKLYVEALDTLAATVVLDPQLSALDRQRLALEAEVPLYWRDERDLALGGHGAVVML